MNKLHAQHFSVIGKTPRPKNMERTTLSSEHRMFVEELALSIFTDMVNSGATLQQTLAAVYLSGSENALAARRDKQCSDLC